MKILFSLFAGIAVFLSSSFAMAAVSFDVIGTNETTGSNDLTLAVAGDRVVIDIIATNTGSVSSATFSASIAGQDLGTAGSPLVFESGQSSLVWFGQTALKANFAFDGLKNTSGTETVSPFPRALSTSDIFNGQLPFLSGSTETPGDSTIGTGVLDFGPLREGIMTTGNGFEFVSGGGVHAKLIFTLTGVGALLGIGAGAGDFVAGPSPTFATESPIPSFIQIGLVPEPATALLIGLGLGGLSFAGRTERRRNESPERLG